MIKDDHLMMEALKRMNLAGSLFFTILATFPTVRRAVLLLSESRRCHVSTPHHTTPRPSPAHHLAAQTQTGQQRARAESSGTLTCKIAV